MPKLKKHARAANIREGTASIDDLHGRAMKLCRSEGERRSLILKATHRAERALHGSHGWENWENQAYALRQLLPAYRHLLRAESNCRR